MFVFTAFVLGFVGSFHCIGMCGPIALTLPVQHLTGSKKLAGILLYNAGRITSYALLGMIFGWLGRQFYLGGLQQWLSVVTGALLLAVVLFKYTGLRISRNHAYTNIFTTKIKTALGQLLRQQRLGTLYIIGLLNGLLPCGLVYLGIAAAVATGGVGKGMLFMAAFGAGTLPAMTAVTYFSHLISIGVRNKMRNMIPVVVSVMAILLIMRGLNLGIPYISPVMLPHSEKVIQNCCHKP
ncbi:sulfite exporter TauE/SafE family protein [Chitinophaga nivalis]|uniref:Sulfite exporter TauE/SafE family protein n=1 Tax=Chitinophaga nivalis TaxID=2991709 RepID=A0ABT3IV47_9BACT|nr:sulfite exporter TauE/SafE family protein [Chitinophaga nivalis]MCW3462466.1 sulfite exporter TauE/SafE family protein [Chitinophaga nivalis]MCW3487843.1 sulfite exporter TauE/SafE family protein [Chitinophaga nivalis]